MSFLRLRVVSPRAAGIDSRILPAYRAFTTSPPLYEQRQKPTSTDEIDLESLLANPTWSVSSLLPPVASSSHDSAISAKQLHHLLRLSALPPPANPAQETSMLSTLSQQLHFVRSIQSVDTTGVEPLRSLRDETAQGEREAEVGLSEMKEALAGESVRGRWHRRIRRGREGREKVGGGEPEDGWEVLGQTGRRTGRYFVVEGGKKEGG